VSDDARPDQPAVDVLIVGAGAAGLAAAIFARRFDSSRSVLLLDGARRPGAKILVSGGSRCNVTNTSVSERDFWGGRPPIIRRVLRAFTAVQTVAFFREIGVPLHEEADGKLFPDSNRSRDVLEALLREAAARGATLLSDHRVTDIVLVESGFRVVTPRRDFLARAVVIATGGQSLPKSGSDGAGFAIARRLGHTVVPTTPALAPLLLENDAFHQTLSGVSHDAELAIWIDGSIRIRLRGALLWTHFGVSGPVAMNASRHWLRARLEERPVAITVNFAPGADFTVFDRGLLDAGQRTPRATAQSFLSTAVPASLAAALLASVDVDARTMLAQLTREERRRIARAIVEWPMPIAGTRGYNVAEATAGGVSLEEIDPATLESRRRPGLFFAGEILDVDGRIGGFNFQWAWSSGFVAGRGSAGRGPGRAVRE
jgi:predicted Rossmann fold flavoprotein